MSKKQNKNLPLSKKQRKKLEKQGITVAKGKTPRTKMEKVQKWTIALVSMICVFAMVCAVFGGILLSRVIKDAKKDPYASNYETLTMERFLQTDKMGKGFYTMNAFDFSGINSKYAPKDMAYMEEYIEELRFNHRKLTKAGQKQTVIGKGDEVFGVFAPLEHGVGSAADLRRGDKSHRFGEMERRVNAFDPCAKLFDISAHAVTSKARSAPISAFLRQSFPKVPLQRAAKTRRTDFQEARKAFVRKL